MACKNKSGVVWIAGPQKSCNQRWATCKNVGENPLPCCDGLTCVAKNASYSQCLSLGPTSKTPKSVKDTSAPSKKPSYTTSAPTTP